MVWRLPTYIPTVKYWYDTGILTDKGCSIISSIITKLFEGQCKYMIHKRFRTTHKFCLHADVFPFECAGPWKGWWNLRNSSFTTKDHASVAMPAETAQVICCAALLSMKSTNHKLIMIRILSDKLTCQITIKAWVVFNIMSWVWHQETVNNVKRFLDMSTYLLELFRLVVFYLTYCYQRK